MPSLTLCLCLCVLVCVCVRVGKFSNIFGLPNTAKASNTTESGTICLSITVVGNNHKKLAITAYTRAKLDLRYSLLKKKQHSLRSTVLYWWANKKWQQSIKWQNRAIDSHHRHRHDMKRLMLPLTNTTLWWHNTNRVVMQQPIVCMCFLVAAFTLLNFCSQCSVDFAHKLHN